MSSFAISEVRKSKNLVDLWVKVFVMSGNIDNPYVQSITLPVNTVPPQKSMNNAVIVIIVMSFNIAIIIIANIIISNNNDNKCVYSGGEGKGLRSPSPPTPPPPGR